MRLEDLRVLEVHPLPGYRLLLRYPDGWRLMDLWGDVHRRGTFNQLASQEIFSQVTVDRYGLVIWPCNIEIGPDTLYEDSCSLSEQRAHWLLHLPLEVSATGGEMSRSVVIPGAPGLRTTSGAEPASTQLLGTASLLVEKSELLEMTKRELVTR